MTIKELKKFASTLADVSPKTEMEIVRLCKKVVLGLYEYIGPQAIEALYAQLEALSTQVETLTAQVANKENKQYMHRVTMQVQVHENATGYLIFYVPRHTNELFTLDTFKTYGGTIISQTYYMNDSLKTMLFNGHFTNVNNVWKLFISLSCIDTTTGYLKNEQKEYNLDAVISFTDTLF